MNIKPVGICPKCYDFIAYPRRDVFFSCPSCGANVITREVRELLESTCADPAGVNDVIDLALGLEEDGNVEFAISVIDKLREFHEYNETVAYTYVRLTGYEPEAVRKYLDAFCEAGGIKPFAQEFLDHILFSEYMMMTPQINKYIDNKLHTTLRKTYREKLGGLKAEYTSGARENQSGIYTMYAFYILGSLVNIGFTILFVTVLNIQIVFLLLIALGVLCTEFFTLFIHNRVFGHRIGIPIHEQYMMVMFMCSIPLVLGGAIIGGLN